MERKYSFLQAPFLAFGNPGLYYDVATHWKGSGALYIFLLSTVAWTISSLSLFGPIMQVINSRDIDVVYNQIPGIVIENGKLTLDRKSPYDIKDNKTGQTYFRIAADRDKEKMLADDPPLVLTQTSILISKKALSESKSSSYQLARYEDAANNSDKDAEPAKVVLRYTKLNEIAPKWDFNGNTVKAWVEKILLSAPIAILVVGWPFVFLGHLIQLLIYGGITGVVASMLAKEMPFEKAMRMSAIAMSPGIVIATVISATQYYAPVVRQVPWPLLSIAVAVIYIVVIIRSLPDPMLQQQTSPPSQLR